MRRARILLLSALLLTLSACKWSLGGGGSQQQSSSSSEAVSSASTSSAAAVSSAPAQASSVPSVVIRVVGMSAQNWSFTPNVIKAKRGENLRIQLHGVSGTHGFSAPAFGINVPIAPGERTTVTIPTNKAGTYEFFCSIPCGSGHKQMRGSIIIE